MGSFSHDVLRAVAREREVTLTTVGRKSGKEHRVTIWITTDGTRLFIRSGQGLRRHWPQNLIARGEGELQLGKLRVKVKPRMVTDPAEARAVSALYRKKYGPLVRASKPNQPLTPGEQATFELIPAD
ncbi:MAG TPA: nitroreductase/quinone reductase family protein [Candidatus Eisenbacteria bacterium]|nr:nitroreductase/quinone reductase family protein [Candidatus Eisenbacteria bacterium]